MTENEVISELNKMVGKKMGARKGLMRGAWKMRNILFKAKRTDNGEWVEGYYAFIDNVHYIYTGALRDGGLYVLAERFEIDPSTICRCTGIEDKNGKRWQGDIFEASDGEFIQRYIIAWDEDALQWYAECIYISEASLPLCEFKVEEIDVIGNIFDNPELLEGGVKHDG